MNSYFALRCSALPATDPGLSPKAFGPADPFAAQRRIAWSGADNMAVGRTRWDGKLSCEAFPHTELLIVEQGRLTLEGAGAALDVPAGEAAVIGRGTAVRIHAHDGTSWIFCVVSAAAPAALLQPVDLAAELKPSPPPAADVLLTPEPQCRSHPALADSPARTRIGLWDSTPYTRKQVPHPVNELMYILEGKVTLTDRNGRATEFGPGDCAFVPHLTTCSWHSAVNVRKLYCVQDFNA